MVPESVSFDLIPELGSALVNKQLPPCSRVALTLAPVSGENTSPNGFFGWLDRALER
jgi:hypothetical protein